MTFKEEMKERTEVIEKLLVKYLPKAEGYQSQIMEAMEYSVMAEIGRASCRERV